MVVLSTLIDMLMLAEMGIDVDFLFNLVSRSAL